MSIRNRRIRWLVIAGFILCICVPGLLIGLQVRQENLDGVLIQAIKKVDAPAVTRLLDQGASANACDTGEMPPTFSVLLGRLWLRLQHKTAPTASKSPALELCFTRMNDNRADVTSSGLIADALIQHGANVHLPVMIHNRAALDQAARFRMHKTVRLLLSKGAEVNARNDLGITPLMVADAEITALLIEHGADVNAKSNEGNAPLYFAVGRGNLTSIKLLIKSGAEVNATNANGHGALYQAILDRQGLPQKPQIVGLLKQHGARLTKKDKDALARNRTNGLE